MALDENLNKVLKEMWRLDEKIAMGQKLIEEEKTFFNQHIQTIQNYYMENSGYWQNKNNYENLT